MAIVIETSGIGEPADIMRNLMDPVLWREAPLETVLCKKLVVKRWR